MDICNFLKIDYNCVVILKNMNLSYNQAISLIWYFSDYKSSTGYKQITQEKMLEVYSLVDNIKNKKVDFNNLDLYDLISIYKSNLYDTRNEFLLMEKGYILKTMKSLCTNYDICINQSNFEDFYSEIELNILNAIEKSNLNNIGQIIKYIDLYVKGYFRLYLKKYKKQNNELFLDESLYSGDNSKEKSRMDYIANPNNIYEKIEATSFSSKMMEVLETLSPECLSLIMLKYQENYSDDDLANCFDLTIDEIKQKEMKILSLLKDNDRIKVMRK